jgi:hypothetical protein
MVMRRSSGHSDPLDMTSAFLVATTVVDATSDLALSCDRAPSKRTTS